MIYLHIFVPLVMLTNSLFASQFALYRVNASDKERLVLTVVRQDKDKEMAKRKAAERSAVASPA